MSSAAPSPSMGLVWVRVDPHSHRGEPAALRVARTTGCDGVGSIGDHRYREMCAPPQHCRHGERMGANGGVPPLPPQHRTTPGRAAHTTRRLRSNIKVQLHFFTVGTMATFPTWFNYGRLLPWRGGHSQSHAAGQGLQECSQGLIHPCRRAAKLPMAEHGMTSPCMGMSSTPTQHQLSVSMGNGHFPPPFGTAPRLGAPNSPWSRSPVHHHSSNTASSTQRRTRITGQCSLDAAGASHPNGTVFGTPARHRATKGGLKRSSADVCSPVGCCEGSGGATRGSSLPITTNYPPLC